MLPSLVTWRPWPLRWPFYAAFLLACILLISVIELFIRNCPATGCGILSIDSSSLLTSSIFNQLPTLVSLSLSLLWALPNHDVMRMEPYFQMSAPGGARAEDSLFLMYPYKFPLLVPWFAARRGHYVVFLSSCVMLLINFAITPLISGIFENATVQRFGVGNATRGVIAEGAGTPPNISTEFTYAAYKHSWLEGGLPPFTTEEYTLLPVLPGTFFNGSSQLWIAPTTLFEAQLDCQSASAIDAMYLEERGGISINISDPATGIQVPICDLGVIMTNKGFDINSYSYPCRDFTSFLTPWTGIYITLSPDDGFPDLGGGVGGHLLAWAAGADPTWDTRGLTSLPTNLTALFCTTSYYSQPVIATFNMPDGKIQSINRIGDRLPFTNTLYFERIIFGWMDPLPPAADYLDSESSLVGFGYKPDQVPNIDSHLRRRFGPRAENLSSYFPTLEDDGLDLSSHSIVYLYNVHSLPGFMLSDRSLDETTLEQLLDPNQLAAAYNRTLQKLFALAVALEMVDVALDAVETISVEWSGQAQGYVVNRGWARAAQVGLLVVMVITLCLAVAIARRPCNLDGEPNSLAEALRLLAWSPELSDVMYNAEFHTPERIMEEFDKSNRMYSLSLVQGKGPVIQVHGFDSGIRLPSPDADSAGPWMGHLWQMKTVSRAGFLMFFLALEISLALAFWFAYRQNGFPTPFRINSFSFKLVFTYTPLAVGMMVEPVLITIGICHCMVAPYRTLSARLSKSSESLGLDFERSPPQFQLLRALRTGHYSIAAMAGSILLSNVLAITLASLITTTPRGHDIGIQLQTYSSPAIQGSFTEPAQEMYFLLADILMNSSDPPAWTTPDYYVLPFAPVNPVGVESYSGSTIGIGISIKCDVVDAAHIRYGCSDGDGSVMRSTCPALAPSEYDAGNIPKLFLTVDDSCWGHFESTLSNLTETYTEIYQWWDLRSEDNLVPSSHCADTFFALWLERPGDPEPTDSPYQDRLDSLIIKCKSTASVIGVDVSVTASGVVQWATATTPGVTPDVGGNSLTDGTDRLAASFFDVVWRGSRTENAVMPHHIRWLNYLMGIIEPKVVRRGINRTHIPDPAYIVEAFEDVYRRLFPINLYLYEDSMITPGRVQQGWVMGSGTIEGVRIHVGTSPYIIAASILLFIMALMVALFWRGRQPVGHVPQTLVGMYALLYASNAKEECGQLAGEDPESRAIVLEQLDGTYLSGFFHGGRHYGVSRQEET